MVTIRQILFVLQKKGLKTDPLKCMETVKLIKHQVAATVATPMRSYNLNNKIMAIIKDNIVMEGVSGMLGDVVVFRQVRGKTVMANKPRKPRFQSELQRENRSRFRGASAFAKQAMLDPQKKEYYRAKARKLGLPNAYTAAITDYMRKPAVTAIKCKSNASADVTVTAGKAGFSLASVTVTLVNAQGSAIATGMARLKGGEKNKWIVRLKPDRQALYAGGDREGVGRIMVTATDHAGNAVSLAA